MMMNRLLTFCCLLGCLQAAAQAPVEFGAGLVFDDESYAAVPRQSAEDGAKADLPAAVDLTPYCPEVRHQGYIYSCVGWALGYGAMSIQRAVLNQCTDREVITRNAHSALFLYNQIKTEDCDKGSRITDALEFLVQNGDCLAGHFDFDVNNCEQRPDSLVIAQAKRYVIDDYLALFGPKENADIKVLRVKKVLAHNKPVVVGMLVLRNFYDLKNAQYWHPKLGNTAPAGGHAMVVVGYDDHKGAFRLMNSWGKSWGDNGFIWVKYSDFADFCKYGFALYFAAPEKLNQLRETATPQPAEKPLMRLSGDFQFRYLEAWQPSGQPVFETAPAALHRTAYRLQKEDWPVGQLFQLVARSAEHDQYLYVFSIDAQRRVHFHWPRQEGLNEKFAGHNESALLVAGSTEVIVPGPTRALQLAHPGTDRLIVLFSKRKIETIGPLAERLRHTQGDFMTELNKILGKFALEPSDITYHTGRIGFEASSRSEGFIVPLVLEVKSN
ncbi:MAG: C1 family peptidase [Saprospiraceae bacterium]|nr:C1 family peptidase [Saprospiraceae bacterium]